MKEVFVARQTLDHYGTVFSTAFSPDPEQKFLYVADLPNYKVRVLDRQTLQEIPGSGSLAVDSEGNIYAGRGDRRSRGEMGV